MSSTLPNLPGFRSNKPVASKTKQAFKFVNGYPIPVPEAGDTGVKRQLTNYAALAAAAPQIAKPNLAALPTFISEDRKVMLFRAYFKESVDESALENFRVRKCEILCYLTDGSLQISEPKQENSGIPQGTFVRRHKIHSPNPDKEYMDSNDLVVGQNVTIYGRTFYIVDCDEWTRRTLESSGIAVPEAQPYPVDPYSKARSEFEQRETGADQTVYRGAVNNPMKEFMEASLGNASKNNRRLGQYLQNCNKVLRFDAYWDDSSRTYGKLHFLTFHYFLVDDTVEVKQKLEPNSGCDPVPQVLRRSYLKKDFGGTYMAGSGDKVDPSECIGYNDLFIGATLNVFGKQVVLIDADKFTRDFYLKGLGKDLGPSIIKKRPVKVFARETEPPSRDGGFGIGSEEDSRMSWESLHPKPPKKDMQKLLENDGKIMTFAAKLTPDTTKDQVDRERKFTISFFLSDDTLSVFEPPVRNSGVIGGKFAARGKYVNPTTNKYFAPDDLAVGAIVGINGRKFMINEVDPLTQSMMTSGGNKGFSPANIQKVINKLKAKLSLHSTDLAKTFRDLDEDASGFITYDELSEFLNNYFREPKLSTTEMFVIMRYFDRDGEGHIDLNEFSDKIVGKDLGVNNFDAGASAGGPGAQESEFAISEEDLIAYQKIAEAAQEESRLKQFLKVATKDFRGKTESIKNSRIQQAFRAKDTEFIKKISKSDFTDVLEKTVKLAPDRAAAVADDVWARNMLADSDLINHSQYSAAFTFDS
jgi:Ca2+-binding EF-hand superfamily protein